MIVELVLEREPELNLVGYERIELPVGVLLSNPVEKRIDIVMKRHPDGRVSVFTDKSDVVKAVLRKAKVVDVHARSVSYTHLTLPPN